MAAEALNWQAEVVGSIGFKGVRFPRLQRARDGSLVVEGWCAWEWAAGEHAAGRWEEIIRAGETFHAEIASLPRPSFIDRRTDSWAIADRLAWGELPPHDFVRVKHLGRLLTALRPVHEPSQLIHGDLTGNVLFAEDLPPAIIDLSPYWRPVAFASAIVVADALVWQGADRRVIDAVSHIPHFEQFLLRALIYRAVADRLFRQTQPARTDDADPFLPAVELALHLL